MTHLHPVPPELERYIGREDLAKLMGVSVRQVVYWVELGCPSHTWGLKRRVFLPSEVLRWAHERERRAA